MTRKIPETTKEKIRILFKNGISTTRISVQTGVSYSSVYGLTKLKERGYKSAYEYNLQQIKLSGFNSYSEYQKYNAKIKKYRSIREYFNNLAEKRTKREENKVLSHLIVNKLIELNKNQNWLAKQLEVSTGMVSLYVQGKSIPSSDRFDKLVGILFSNTDNKPRSIEELVDGKKLVL